MAGARSRARVARRLHGAVRGAIGVVRIIWRQRRRVAIFLGPWLLAVGLSVPLLWTQIDTTHREARAARSQNTLRGAEDIIRRVLDRLGRDILFLSSLTGGLPMGELRPDGIGGRLFLAFSASSPDDNQVRWLDEAGQERLRVDQEGGRVRAIPPDELQDKSARDYFRDSRTLPERGVYFSALDLNVEHGQVERTFRPMLRVASPVVVDGKRRGVVIINSAVRTLLTRLSWISSFDSGISLFLVNGEGNWIKGPAPELDGSWQLGAARHGQAADLSQLWAVMGAAVMGAAVMGAAVMGAAVMGAATDGQWSDGRGVWSFHRLELGRCLITGREACVLTGPGTTLHLLGEAKAGREDDGVLGAKVILSVPSCRCSPCPHPDGLRGGGAPRHRPGAPDAADPGPAGRQQRLVAGPCPPGRRVARDRPGRAPLRPRPHGGGGGP